jgi:allophanate hydrolase subunit 1
MDLKLARTELKSKAKAVTLKKVEEMVAADDSVIIYFDRDNSHKDLLALQDHFEAQGKSFYMNEVKFGLSEEEYLYEVHVL